MRSLFWLISGLSLIFYFTVYPHLQEEKTPQESGRITLPKETHQEAIRGDSQKIHTAEEKALLDSLKFELLDKPFINYEGLVRNWGEKERLSGSSYKTGLILYYEKTDFTIMVDVENNRISNVWLGRHPL